MASKKADPLIPAWHPDHGKTREAAAKARLERLRKAGGLYPTLRDEIVRGKKAGVAKMHKGELGL